MTSRSNHDSRSYSSFWPVGGDTDRLTGFLVYFYMGRKAMISRDEVISTALMPGITRGQIVRRIIARRR